MGWGKKIQSLNIQDFSFLILFLDHSIQLKLYGVTINGKTGTRKNFRKTEATAVAEI